jgi:glucose/arabinose dehydrogenase
MAFRWWCCSRVVFTCLLAACWVRAGTLPFGFVETALPGTFNEAVGFTWDDYERMFVWERGGRVWVVENGVKSTQPLIDISEEVGAWSDYGLLGFALHPNFTNNGYIYLMYIVDHHHLMKFGTAEYRPATNEYFQATSCRLTRYTCRASDGFRSVDPASRLVMFGDTPGSGPAILHITHGTGQLVFGTDGTLLASVGDGASPYTADVGSAEESYYQQALAEGIIRPEENVGAFRAQMLNSMNGKILRLDPLTGNGVPSNPFYDAANPKSVPSRVWALGLRNPFRISLRPNSGSTNAADGRPGVFYIGDVGWLTWEDMNVCTGPGQNFGWPLYEGLEAQPDYMSADIENQDAPNPLFGISGCTRRCFYFRELLKQDTPGAPSWPNPCNPAQQIPANIPRFVHTRPVLDWKHGAHVMRTGIFSDNNAAVIGVGDNGSPVAGVQVPGNCSVAGTWYTGGEFPSEYKNTYFHGDWGGGWIMNFRFTTDDKPAEVNLFAQGLGPVVHVTTHPRFGELYYVSWFSNRIYKISYGATNRPPIAVINADKRYGARPLTVQFSSVGSVDPDGQPITFSWSFGDGTASSTAPDPSHTFSPAHTRPTNYVVRLVVAESGGRRGTNTLNVSVNNTPPVVTITNPTNNTRYSVASQTTYPLSANVADAEHSTADLRWEWQTILHHNDHTHAEPVDTNAVTTTLISPTSCDLDTYHYAIKLTVTDVLGLSGTDEVVLYPDCRSGTLTFGSRDSAGNIILRIAGVSAGTVTIEASSNLVSWSAVALPTNNNGTLSFNDPDAAGMQVRFYRARFVNGGQ